jgi:hypothetical protein
VRIQPNLLARNIAEVADATAMLLRSWNKEYYRFRKAQAKSLVADLHQLITAQLGIISQFQQRSLPTLESADQTDVLSLFSIFTEKLGVIGAAKALHLLAPNFFPLWDNAIAYQYGVVADSRGYFLFMAITEHQIRSLMDKLPDGMAPLKTLDEYNYCKYTKSWIV